MQVYIYGSLGKIDVIFLFTNLSCTLTHLPQQNTHYYFKLKPLLLFCVLSQCTSCNLTHALNQHDTDKPHETFKNPPNV